MFLGGVQLAVFVSCLVVTSAFSLGSAATRAILRVRIHVHVKPTELCFSLHIIVIIFFLVCLFVCFINWMQGAHKDKLPAGLQSWDWLPVWMRSLEPMDRAICGPMAKMCCKAPTTTPTVNKEPSGEATTASAV